MDRYDIFGSESFITYRQFGNYVKYEDAMREINKLKNEIKVLKEDLKCAVRRNNE